MCRALFFVLPALLLPAIGAAEEDGQAWIRQADSLRRVGQDAAALDFLNSAEQQFRKSGQECWVARFSERKARIHLDWKNPVHASEALAAALMAAASCPELGTEIHGWRFALARSMLDLGNRDEARWILKDLAAYDEPGEGLALRILATESMGRLARMSMEEGDFREAAADFDRWAEGLRGLDRLEESLDAVGWAAVCTELDGVPATDRWSALRADPTWRDIPLPHRAKRGLEWASILLGAGAAGPFDTLSEWPWALGLERSPGTVDGVLETQWALLRAKRHRREHAAQALAASHQAELAARSIEGRERRDALLSEALRLRADILAGTGAYGPAYFALAEADSLSLAAGRAERSRTGLFESEPWLSAIGDERTRMETERMDLWRKSTFAMVGGILIVLIWAWRSSLLLGRVRSRLRRLQRVWLPGRQHQIRELALSGARLAAAARTHALPAELQQEMADFGRLASLCSDEMRREPVDLRKLCLYLAEQRPVGGSLEWSLHEEVPFEGDAVQLEDFLSTLLSGLGQGPCRMDVNSTTSGLTVTFDGFVERGWWREAMTLFAADGEDRKWSLIRLRCDRLGGALKLDCDAAGARTLEVALPVYSA